MNNVFTAILFFFIVIFIVSNINWKIALIMSFVPLVFLQNNPIYAIYAFISSIIILSFTKKYSFKDDSILINLTEEEKKLESEIEEIKKETQEYSIIEKRNQILISIFNILSKAFEVSAIKQVEKYINDYLSDKTSLFIKTDDGFDLIYGSNETINQISEIKQTPEKTYIPIDDLFVMVIKEDKNLKQAIELISEIKALFKRIYLFSKVESLSLKDGMSGLYRRQIFNERLDDEIIRARNFRYLVGIMMIDIDHFKKINDTYGHQAGDEVIKQVARILKNCVYETDFVARYGGEEFVIIMPRAQRDGSKRKAQYIRQMIENTKFKFGIIELKVTISIGIAYYPDDAIDKNDLIEKADKALYYSKENGRNRVTDYIEIT